MDPNEEVASLRREVDALRRTVDALVELLHREGAFGALDRVQVQRRLSAAAREDEAEGETEQEPAALVASAYRGVGPGGSGLACAACGKRLDEDDPELVMKQRGRVCVACFHRG